MSAHETVSSDLLAERLRAVVVAAGQRPDPKLIHAAADRITALYFGNAEPWSIDPEVLERVKNAVSFARARRYLAVSIDIADMTAILTAIGAEP